MKYKPIIGVTPLMDYDKKSVWMLPGYLKGLEAAGAVAVILPFFTEYKDAERCADIFDGFLFAGGQDVDPSVYHEDRLPLCGEISPERDVSEAMLFRAASGLDKPILGICRGMQLINALMGGTLWQDISSQYSDRIQHTRIPPDDIPKHDIIISKWSPLYDILKTDRISVNSYHHQGIREVSPALKVMAEAPDGLIEAVYAPAYRFIRAVQWHPELLFETDKSASLLFSEFVNKCR